MDRTGWPLVWKFPRKGFAREGWPLFEKPDKAESQVHLCQM